MCGLLHVSTDLQAIINHKCESYKIITTNGQININEDLMLFIYLLTYSLTYLLIPYSTVLLQKLSVSQLVKKFPTFYGTRRFITAFTTARHLSLSWATSIQSIPPHPTSWRSILILSSHLRLGLPSSLFPSGFPTTTLYTPLHSTILDVLPLPEEFNVGLDL